MIIFGAGDLLHRKLMPSLFHLMEDGLLPDDFTVITVARESLDDGTFRTQVGDAIRTFLPNGATADKTAIANFTRQLYYCSGELNDVATYDTLRARLAETDARQPGGSGRLFYLAIPPSLYAGTINLLAESGIAPRVMDPKQRPWVRVVIEKPFGQSLASAVALNACVRRAFSEHQVYRIDHYLGKETVQNLLVFRFANSIFEPICNRQHVHSVQITAAESVGVEHRGKYYEEAGVVRDMFQNHLLQLLTLTAMEPPVTFSADAVRDEKVKVLRAIRPITPDRHARLRRARPVRPRDDRREAGPRLSARAECRARQRHADLLRHPLHDRQLALARRPILPQVRQAHAEAGVRDRDPVPEATASHVPDPGKPDHRIQYAWLSGCSPRRGFRCGSR